MDIEGLAVTLLDTAGLRESADVVESMGIARALERAERADLRVFLAFPDDALPMAPLAEDIVMHPKGDLFPNAENGISGVTGQGVQTLVTMVGERLKERAAGVGIATHERHRIAMLKASESLLNAQDIVVQGTELYDIAAEELRSAIRMLESLVGRIDVESLLDEIFSSFCIGK